MVASWLPPVAAARSSHASSVAPLRTVSRTSISSRSLP